MELPDVVGTVEAAADDVCTLPLELDTFLTTVSCTSVTGDDVDDNSDAPAFFSAANLDLCPEPDSDGNDTEAKKDDVELATFFCCSCCCCLACFAASTFRFCFRCSYSMNLRFSSNSFFFCSSAAFLRCSITS